MSRSKDIESFNKLRELGLKISKDIQQSTEELTNLNSNLIKLKQNNGREAASLKEQLENTSVKRKIEQDQYQKCIEAGDKKGALHHSRRKRECNIKYSIIKKDIQRLNNEIEKASDNLQEKNEQIEKMRKERGFVLAQMRSLYSKITGKSTDTLTHSH